MKDRHIIESYQADGLESSQYWLDKHSPYTCKHGTVPGFSLARGQGTGLLSCHGSQQRSNQARMYVSKKEDRARFVSETDRFE